MKNLARNTPDVITKERVATQCVCCDGLQLTKSQAILMPFVAHRVFGWEPAVIDDSWGLKTIKNGTAYTLANSLFCTHCGFLFLDMRFDDNEMTALYNGYRDQQYTALREKYEPGYSKRNDFLTSGANYISEVEKFLSPLISLPVRILDWGGDTGKNTPFKNNNTVFHIFDISNQKPIADAEIVDKKTMAETDYDLIVCSHVLEHIPYPAELLLAIKNVMHENTLLYIELPYEEMMRTAAISENLSVKKRHWHEHINFYSEKSLIQLLSRCGFQVIHLNHLKISDHNNQATYFFQIACSLNITVGK